MCMYRSGNDDAGAFAGTGARGVISHAGKNVHASCPELVTP